MARAPRILLADADAFYVAVARLIDPEGAGRATLLLVGGSAEGRGVVTSASYETRAYGVHSGMPMARALDLCPAALRVPVPREACARTSREIRAVLERFTPIVEAASIDEFYLDLSGTEQLYRGAPVEQIARTIREAVRRETAIDVSIGGGTSRLVAKLAAQRAKPHRSGRGVYVVPPGEEGAFLAEHALADLPMIGPRFQERLAARGLRSVTDALRYDEDRLMAWFGERAGRWLYRRIRGIDPAPVRGRIRSKSLGHEETFASDLVTDDALRRELLRLAGRSAADLRAKGYVARTITVKLRDADFTTRQASHTFRRPVAGDRAVAAAATRLLARLRAARRMPVRLLGVTLAQLAHPDRETTQLTLFAGSGEVGGDEERDQKLSQALDDVAERYGRGRLVRGTEVDRRRPISS